MVIKFIYLLGCRTLRAEAIEKYKTGETHRLPRQLKDYCRGKMQLFEILQRRFAQRPAMKKITFWLRSNNEHENVVRNLVLFDEYRCEEDNPDEFTQSSLRRPRRLQRALNVAVTHHGGPTKKLKDMRKWTIDAIETNRTDFDMTDNILCVPAGD